MAVRAGIGFDAHRLVPGRPLILGGVEVPSPAGLEGHSDGDVLIHAIVDAILGAASAGDIGTHFPATDPRWRGAPSLGFLEHAAAIVAERGGCVVNVDATLVLERPKVADFVGEMRARIAAALGLAPDAVGVKATTTDGLGFAGRGEGAAAFAVALVDTAPAAAPR